MLIDFFLKCKNAGLPVSTKEFLVLLESLKKGVIGPSIDEFYFLSRLCLIKDETKYDKYDRCLVSTSRVLKRWSISTRIFRKIGCARRWKKTSRPKNSPS